MSAVIDMSSRREPVFYTIDVKHNWDGTVEIEVGGLANDARSARAVADALLEAAAIAERRASL